MGEYAENASGHRIKLGTCEDLMYVTRQDIEALGAAGWKDDNDQNVRSYLDIEACRVALPRLYDVAGDVARIEAEKPEFPHRYRINLDAATVEMLRDIDHSDIYFHKAGTNFFVPCPMGQKWDKSIKSSQIHHHIDLVAEGKLKVAPPSDPLASTAPANAVSVPTRAATRYSLGISLYVVANS